MCSSDLQRALASFNPVQMDPAPVLYADGTANLLQHDKPLSTYLNSTYGDTRASFDLTDNGSGKYTYTVYTPLIISPLDKGVYNMPYFANVNNFNVNVNFQDSTHVNTFTSIASGVDPSKLDITVLSAQLHYEYLVPPAEKEIPDVSTYTYDSVLTVSKKMTLGSNASSDSLKLSTTPKLVYFSLVQNPNERNPTILDVGCEITGFQVQWGSKGSVFFSEYTQYDMWRMTMRNTGSDMSFLQWKNGCNVVVFNPAKDIGNNLETLGGSTSSSVMFQIKNVKWNKIGRAHV